MKRRELFAWVIQCASDEQLIGMVERAPTAHVVELGYVLAYHRRGQGLMSEAVTAVVAASQQHPDVFRIRAYFESTTLRRAACWRTPG